MIETERKNNSARRELLTTRAFVIGFAIVEAVLIVGALLLSRRH